MSRDRRWIQPWIYHPPFSSTIISGAAGLWFLCACFLHLGCRPQQPPIPSGGETPTSLSASKTATTGKGETAATSGVDAEQGSGRADGPAIATGSSPPAEPKGRQHFVKRAGGDFDLTFDSLEFVTPPGEDFRREMLTEEIEGFDGKRITIRGFILDSSVFTQKGITQFVLIRDNQVCCFGPGAKIFHNMMVDMKPGKSADFTIRPVTARGVLKIQPWVSPADGKTYSVFHLDADSVK